MDLLTCSFVLDREERMDATKQQQRVMITMIRSLLMLAKRLWYSGYGIPWSRRP